MPFETETTKISLVQQAEQCGTDHMKALIIVRKLGCRVGS